MKTITLPEAIKMLSQSWEQIKMGTVTNCFLKGGFSNQENVNEENIK